VSKAVSIFQEGQARAIIAQARRSSTASSNPDVITLATDDSVWKEYARLEAEGLQMANWRDVPRPGIGSRKRKASALASLSVVETVSETSSEEEVEEDEDFDVEEAEALKKADDSNTVLTKSAMAFRFEVLAKQKAAAKDGRASLEAMQARKAWTNEETAALICAVDVYGCGCWQLIIDDAVYQKALGQRSAANLKDRHRNIHRRIGYWRSTLDKEIRAFKDEEE